MHNVAVDLLNKHFDSEDDYRSGFETSITVTSSFFQNYTHLVDHTRQTTNVFLFVLQELELLPAKELQNSVYIKHSVSLEQVCIFVVKTM